LNPPAACFFAHQAGLAAERITSRWSVFGNPLTPNHLCVPCATPASRRRGCSV